jgi:hypothetical protein
VVRTRKKSPESSAATAALNGGGSVTATATGAGTGARAGAPASPHAQTRAIEASAPAPVPTPPPGVDAARIASAISLACELGGGHPEGSAVLCLDVGVVEGGRILVASGGESRCVVVHDYFEERIVCVLKGHIKAVTHVQFDPHDGDRVVSCGLDRTVRLWSWAAGTALVTWTGHTNVILGLAYSAADPDHLFTCSSDHSLKVWATDGVVDTGAVEQRQQIASGHTNAPMSAMCFLPSLAAQQQQTLLVAVAEKGRLREYEFARGQLDHVRTLAAPCLDGLTATSLAPCPADPSLVAVAAERFPRIMLLRLDAAASRPGSGAGASATPVAEYTWEGLCPARGLPVGFFGPRGAGILAASRGGAGAAGDCVVAWDARSRRRAPLGDISRSDAISAVAWRIAGVSGEPSDELFVTAGNGTISVFHVQ